ncbi:MAG: TOBE domain-containing protein [Haloarculaceae archaeon]
MDVTADFDARLASGDVALTGRDRELLAAIDEHGSLNRATAELGRSYSHAQRRIVELEAAFGPLVDRERGGERGGGSELTEGARSLLAAFDRVRAEFAGVASAQDTVLAGTVADRDGELAVIDTALGSVRAIAPPDAEAVDVAVRADAVTLNRPNEAPEPGGTSARNQFRGTVATVDRGEAIATVAVDVGDGVALTALVTLDSVERLDLATGTPVVASFKATATRAVPRDLR